jgi:hypothetical protein
MRSRIQKVKKEHGQEILGAILVVGVVSGYAYWGSLMLR